MKIVNSPPPNYAEILQHFSPPPGTVFCYGQTIYNPSKGEIPPDIEYHESIHMAQQAKYSTPDLWYIKYFLDPQFRLDQELEAYSAQYLWVKQHAGSKAARFCLEESAGALSRDYKLPLNPQQALSKIRNRAKSMVY